MIKKLNLNGRICLKIILEFGILGTIILYFIHPYIKKMLLSLSMNAQIILSGILFVVYLIDNVISFNVLNKIKNKIKHEKKDNTEEINNKIKKWISNNNIYYKRLKSAFPKFTIPLNKNKFNQLIHKNK